MMTFESCKVSSRPLKKKTVVRKGVIDGGLAGTFHVDVMKPSS